MLEAMAIFILVIVGVVLIIAILGYGIYITFYPLTKTIKGGIDAMKEHAGEEKKKVGDDRDARTSTDRLHRAGTKGRQGMHKRGQQSKT
jgi:hypothetical protein